MKADMKQGMKPTKSRAAATIPLPDEPRARRPYPGLRAFHRDEADLFFGREEQVDQLLDKLAETHFLAVLGTSGSGKSSLVRAGLLPALDSGVLPGPEPLPQPLPRPTPDQQPPPADDQPASAADTAPTTPTGWRWSVAELRPGDQPFRRLARELIQRTGVGADCPDPNPGPDPGPGRESCIEQLEQDLRRGSRALNWRLGTQPLPAGERLLILVDQFEELFRYQRTNAHEAAAFVALLLAAARHPDVYVVITLRSEFLGDCSRYPDLPEAINAGLFLTPRMSPEQVADAVQLPARLPGFDGDVTPGLVRRLLDQAAGEQDQLLLLQHLLMRLWDLALAPEAATDPTATPEPSAKPDRPDQTEQAGATAAPATDQPASPTDAATGPILDEDGLKTLGGLHAALDLHAEKAYADLSADQQATAAVLFRALTERGDDQRDTRRPVTVAEVARIAGVDSEQVIACAEPFRRAGRSFLMPPAKQALKADDHLDITHEALIRQWQRLQQWTADEAKQAELYERLASAAEREADGTGALWIDPDLQIALDWREENQAGPTWAERYQGDYRLAMRFLDAGRTERERRLAAKEAGRQQALRRAWVIAGGSLVALLLTLALAGWAWFERDHALEAKAEARQSAAVAEKQKEKAQWHASIAEKQKEIAEQAKDRAQNFAGVADAERRKAERAGQERTEQLFESGLTHASLLAQVEDYAAAWQVLGRTLTLDGSIPAERRHARNLLAGFVDLRRGEADLVYREAGAALYDLALSPDGRWLVAAGERGTLLVFDAVGGELLRRLEGHDADAGNVGAVRAVRFSADGGTLYSAGDDRRIIRWSVPDWRRMSEWRAPAAVWSLALSPDGGSVASAGKDDGITLWSIVTGDPVHPLSGETSSIADGSALAWLPDGRLVSGALDGRVGLWDTETEEEQVLPRVHTDQVSSVAVSPDGRLIATGSRDKRIVLWDAASGRPLRLLRGHQNDISGLTFDPSGKRLLSASDDNDLRLWDIASGTTLRVFQGHQAGLWSVLTSDGLAYTAANDGTLRRWPLGTGGARGGTGSEAGPGQWVWDLEGGEPKSAGLLLDGSNGGAGALLIGLGDGSLRGFALPSAGAGTVADAGPDADRATDGTDPSDPNQPGALRLSLPDAHDSSIKRLAFSADGKTLATASLDATAHLWRIARGGDTLALEPLHRFEQHSGVVHGLAFSPDDRLLVTASYDGRVGLFDVLSGDGELSRAATLGKVVSVEFTPDGNRLLTANYEEGLLRLWQRDGLRLTDGRTIAELSDKPLWATLSPCGRRVAVVGRGASRVELYDLPPSTADPTAPATPVRLVGHENAVFRAIFAPDGRQLATVGSDMTVRVWDLGAEPDSEPDSEPDPGQAPGNVQHRSDGGGQALFTLRLPTEYKSPSPLWDFDFRCTDDQATCWIAVPLTIGRVALYRLPYADPPPGLRPPAPAPTQPDSTDRPHRPHPPRPAIQ